MTDKSIVSSVSFDPSLEILSDIVTDFKQTYAKLLQSNDRETALKACADHINDESDNKLIAEVVNGTVNIDGKPVKHSWVMVAPADDSSGRSEGDNDDAGDGDDQRSEAQKQADEQAAQQANDDKMKDQREKLQKRKENNDSTSALDKSTRKGSQGFEQKNDPYSFKRSYIPPRFKWDQILGKMVRDADIEEESYTKPPSNASTVASVLSQTGAAAVKPGITTYPDTLKMAIIVDSSGSMTGVINKVYNELEALLKRADLKRCNFVFVRFSDSFEMFLVNMQTQK